MLDSALTTLGDLPLPAHLGVSAPALPGTAAAGVPLGLGLSVGNPAAKPIVGLDINLGALTGQSQGPAIATTTTAAEPTAAPATQPDAAGADPVADPPPPADPGTLASVVSSVSQPVANLIAGL